MSPETQQSLPPLTIEYVDGETFIETQRPISPDRQMQLARICMEAVQYGATVTNAFPAYVGSQEGLHTLKLAASRQNIPLQYHQSDGTCGIMK